MRHPTLYKLMCIRCLELLNSEQKNLQRFEIKRIKIVEIRTHFDQYRIKVKLWIINWFRIVDMIRH